MSSLLHDDIVVCDCFFFLCLLLLLLVYFEALLEKMYFAEKNGILPNKTHMDGFFNIVFYFFNNLNIVLLKF